MPTGYTATLINEGQTFEQFVLICARNFGALITMRDEPLTAPIPDEIQPSPFYRDALTKAQKRLAKLRGMTAKQQSEEVAKIRAQERKLLTESRASSRRTNLRLNEMRKAVNRWQPPSADHVGLKKFMLQQIDISREDPSWTRKQIAQMEAKSYGAMWAEIIARAERDVEWYAAESAKEADRTAKRNHWLKQLCDSLESVAVAQ